jgi:hypothetical protein
MLLAMAVAAVLALPLLAQAPEPVDYDAIFKIKEEGFQRSQVMQIASYLTDVYGPRLTGSPNIKDAGEWAKQKLTEWGLVNARLEPWGPFGRGWTNERFYAQVVAPRPFPLIGYPLAWTPGTDGTVTAEVVPAVIETDADFEKFRGQLKGKIVLTAPMREVAARFQAPGQRYTDEQLAERARQPVPAGPRPFPRPAVTQEFVRKRTQFFLDEGVVALFEPGRGDGGTVFVQSGGSRDANAPPAPPRVALAIEHYGRIVRMLEKKVPVTVELNIVNKFHSDDPNAFNVMAEIPGTDKADELVMLGAHFDSWHSGTGATDNGAGSAVMLEVVRILKATGLKMRRTVRIGLWTGEEQGLLGSRAYVTQQFADRRTMALKPAHAKFSGYFNIDNGTGMIRGIYLQGNEAVAPIFARWMEPFRNLGMTTISIRNTGGTDHQAFDAVGLPGFQFIQDPIEYDSRTHHSNMDVYERLQEQDLKQIAVIVASFVYHAASRAELLPRKPLPQPSPGGPPQRPAQE